MSRRLPCIAAIAVLACNRTSAPLAPIQAHVALHAVTSCPAVERAIQEAASGISPALCPIGMGMMCGYWGASTTKLTVVGAEKLEVLSEAWLPGWSAHARRIGSQVHVVLTDQPRWPVEVKWWPTQPDIWN